MRRISPYFPFDTLVLSFVQFATCGSTKLFVKLPDAIAAVFFLYFRQKT